MFTYDPVATLGGGPRHPSSRWSPTTTRPGRARTRWRSASAARVAAGRGPIEQVSFGHDGHNLMRYRPREVAAAIASVGVAGG